jgi:murein DD-endopeptidase MepM/ murein hydrolase activator NlpD
LRLRAPTITGIAIAGAVALFFGMPALGALADPVPLPVPSPSPSCTPDATGTTVLCPVNNTVNSAPVPAASAPSAPSASLPPVPAATGAAPGGSVPTGGTSAASAGQSLPAPPAAEVPNPNAPSTIGPALTMVEAAQVSARFSNQPFLGDLLNILGNPIAAQPPQLTHFTLERPAAGPAAHLGPIPLPPPPPAMPSGVAVGLLGLFSGAFGGTLLARARSVIAASSAGAILLAAGGTGATGIALERAAMARPAATVETVTGTGEARMTQAMSRPAWDRLVAIEAALAMDRRTLTAQETDLQRLSLPESLDPRFELGPQRAAATVTPRVAALVSSHQRSQADYRTALDAEYRLFRDAAQDAGLRDQILAGAAASGDARTQQAVEQDLALARAQLEQEAAIQAAAGQLERVGSLSPAEIQAITSHQPFMVPVAAPVSQPFGPNNYSFEPPLEYNGVFYPHFHTGIDLAAPQGTPIHASADGVAVLVRATADSHGHLVGYGNYIVVAHPDGFMTVYAHLLSVAVKQGDVVHQGDVIGEVGMTGNATGPHLHFEIRHDRVFIDPMPYLTGQRPD